MSSDDTKLPNQQPFDADTAVKATGNSTTQPELAIPRELIAESKTHATSLLSQHSKQVFDVESAYNEKEVQLGTIVTDRRKKKHSFGNTLKSAFEEWWGDTQANVKKTKVRLESLKPKEVPEVEVATARTNVIQEAAKYAAQVPRDDHDAVIEKIKTLKHDAEVVTGKPFLLKAEMPEEPKWKELPQESEKQIKPQTRSLANESHESLPPRPTSGLASYASMDPLSKKETTQLPTPAFTVSPMTKRREEKITAVTKPLPVEKQPQYAKPPEKWLDLRTVVQEHIAEEPEERTSGVVSPFDSITDKELPNSSSVPPLHKKELPHLQPIPAPTQPHESVLPPSQKPTPRPTPLLEKPAPTVPLLRPQRSNPVSRSSFLPRLPILLIGAVVTISAGLILYGVFKVTTNIAGIEDTPPVVTLTIPAFLATDLKQSIPLLPSRTTLLKEMADAVSKDAGAVTHIYPVVKTDGGDIPATTAEFMDILLPHTAGTFIRGLGKEFMFGSVRTTRSEPYLILRSSNFDVAFAGMLVWEENMSRDLYPLFGEVVEETNISGNSASSTVAHFVDALATNQSIRILYDKEGNERIVYAFVNANYIIITTTTEALASLIERLQ